MWTRRSFSAALLSAAGAPAQAVRPATITIPNGVPLSLWSSDFAASAWGDGFADLRGTIEFRNEGSKRIRALSLAIATPPGAAPTASILLPSLDAGRGEAFSAPVRLRLAGAAVERPWAEVSVDGCLTADLGFSGPDLRNSRRRLIVAELEARRERSRLRAILAAGGEAGLAGELDRLARRRSPGAAAAPSTASGARIEAAVIEIEGAPLEITTASAQVSDARAGNATAGVGNRSESAIRSFELGWAATDRNGDRVFAGSIASPTGLLAAGGLTTAASTAAIRAPQGAALSGSIIYLRNAEFADGRFWMPNWVELEAAGLTSVEPVSNEARRIIGLRDRDGIAAAARAVGIE